MKTLNKQISLFGEDRSISLPEDSHANLTAKQEKDLEKRTTVIYGRKCLEPYGKLNPPGLWAKTFMAYLIGRGDWYSKRCKLTWKRKATKYNRLYFRLQVSTRRTNETESGLLPTVTAFDSTKPKNLRKSTREGFKKGWKKDMGLLDYMTTGMLPTPNARDYKGRTGSGWENQSSLPNILLPTPRTPTNNGTGYAKNSKKGRLEDRVPELIEKGMLPTPMAQDSKNSTFPKSQKERDTMPGFVMSKLETGKGSQLNPRFVAEMMGFPPNWTELPFLNGEMKA